MFILFIAFRPQTSFDLCFATALSEAVDDLGYEDGLQSTATAQYNGLPKATKDFSKRIGIPAEIRTSGMPYSQPPGLPYSQPLCGCQVARHGTCCCG